MFPDERIKNKGGILVGPIVNMGNIEFLVVYSKKTNQDVLS